MAAQAQAKQQKSSTNKMQTFVWEGADRKGKKTKGELSGPNLALVKAELRKQGITPKKVRKKQASLFGERKQKIEPNDVAVFARQLATMMKAGVPLVQAFEIVAGGLENPSMRELVLSIKTEVESGNSLANGLRKHPRYFDELFCNLVDSGEQSGALETMLDRIATYKEKTEALKQKLKKAVKYPIAVVLVAIVVTAVILLKVVPTFEDLFSGFGADLPAPTLAVIALSEWMQQWWYILLFVGVGAFFGLREAKLRSKAFRDYLDRFTLKAPVVGEIVTKASMARYCRTLSTTFAAGVPLVDALDSVAGATNNVVYHDAIMNIKEDVSSGTQLNFSMNSTGVFSSMAVQMVAIGEESGALDAMLDKVATYYEDEVDNLVDGLTSMLEPIIMSVLGVLVGGLIVSMYLPIFQMGNVV